MLLCGTFEPLDNSSSGICKQGRYALNNCGGPMYWYILQELPSVPDNIIWSINYSPEYSMCYIFASYQRETNNMQEYALQYPLLQPLAQRYNFISLGHDGLFVLLSKSNIEELSDNKYEPDELGGQLEYFTII